MSHEAKKTVRSTRPAIVHRPIRVRAQVRAGIFGSLHTVSTRNGSMGRVSL